MQQFNLDTWLKDKSRKVVTRNNKPVRIVCWDKLGEYPIIGCIKDSDDYEDFESYNINGSKYSFDREDRNDLFFADEEEELTEFEKAVNELITHYIFTDTVNGDDVKNEAVKLLDIAREEILKDLPKWKRSNSFFNTGNKFELGKTSLRRFDGYEIPYSELEKLPKEE